MEPWALHFKEWDVPSGLGASALFDAGPTSGIYILTFSNGEEYVGKTVNSPRRFMDHRRRWSDIVCVRFAPVVAENLDRMERAVMSAREANGVLLRNLLLLSQPLGSSRLDLLIDKQAQAEWLTADAECTGLDVDPQRIALARRRLRSRNKLDQLMRHPQVDAVVAAVAAYISAAIPSPDVGEGTSWTLTAMPTTSRGPRNRRLTTLSIHSVEMLFLGEWRDDADEWVPYAVLNVGAHGDLPAEITELVTSHGRYHSTGMVRSVELEDFRAVPELLGMPEVRRAARSLALGQLRKGRGAFSRFHNDAFADTVFASMSESEAGSSLNLLR